MPQKKDPRRTRLENAYIKLNEETGKLRKTEGPRKLSSDGIKYANMLLVGLHDAYPADDDLKKINDIGICYETAQQILNFCFSNLGMNLLHKG